MIKDQDPENGRQGVGGGSDLPPAIDSDGRGPEGGLDQPRRRAFQRRAGATAARVKSSGAGTLWTRLNAVDFLNSSMVLAALILMSTLPLFTVLSVAVGKDIRHTIIRRMGLNRQAAESVESLISPGHHAVSNLTVFGVFGLLFGVIAIGGTLQSWYRKLYDQSSSEEIAKSFGSQAVWTVAFFFYITAQMLIGGQLGPIGGRALILLVDFAFAIIFWTFSIYLLLLGKIAWRTALPSGLAIAFCLLGLDIFSTLFFSSTIVSGSRDYGPIGVITALLSYFIGFGVCMHLGSVFGRMWSERRPLPTEDSERDGSPAERG